MDRNWTVRGLATATLLLAGAAAGCGDATGPSDRPGSITLGYAGDVVGGFDVTAAPPTFSVEGVPAFSDWALAAEQDSLGGVVIAGFLVDGEEGDLFVLQLTELRAGAFSCSPDAGCHGRLFFGISDPGGLPNGAAREHFEIVSGQVDVSTAGPDRISGAVSFTARSEGGTGPETLTVDDGAFDLSLTDPDAAGSVLCMGSRAAGSGCG